jgi:glycosyltransferase involved in cell wall biosynthesis
VAEPPLVTALVITYNEQDNIARTLDSVAWADRILVVDSGSTDSTLAVVGAYPNATVKCRSFTTFAEQCNFGLSQVTTPWVLSMDADYVFPGGAEHDIRAAMAGKRAAAFAAEFFYAIYGKVVRGSILPPRTLLYRKDAARYVDDGHGHRVVIEGPVARLPFRVVHDDRKPLARWLASQATYAAQEADKLLAATPGNLSLPDRLRKLLVVAPPVVFLLVYVVRGGFLSGWRGLYYALQRFYAELLLCLYLIDRRLRP